MLWTSPNVAGIVTVFVGVVVGVGCSVVVELSAGVKLGLGTMEVCEGVTLNVSVVEAITAGTLLTSNPNVSRIA